MEKRGFEVWKELKEKYYEDDQFRIAQLQEELTNKLMLLSLPITIVYKVFGKNWTILDPYQIV